MGPLPGFMANQLNIFAYEKDVYIKISRWASNNHTRFKKNTGVAPEDIFDFC